MYKCISVAHLIQTNNVNHKLYCALTAIGHTERTQHDQTVPAITLNWIEKFAIKMSMPPRMIYTHTLGISWEEPFIVASSLSSHFLFYFTIWVAMYVCALSIRMRFLFLVVLISAASNFMFVTVLSRRRWFILYYVVCAKYRRWPVGRNVYRWQFSYINTYISDSCTHWFDLRSPRAERIL